MKKFKNEKGAISIEFLGILPFFFMFFLLLWQVVASGYAVHTVKMASNAGAKTYAATTDINEAKDTITDAIGSSSVIDYQGMNVTLLDSNGKFELNVQVSHSLIFVPDQWKPSTSITLDEKVVSQVLVE
ncbi:TadE/TadG family type IV pilus assembly protein [Oceanobacillus salinisoli]|uniref:TadE/TadG family type IV pilus assembly protein n=1 Tax=Oceanobacillus salinisoli TaxID=2678611 RepID=UPI0012E21112|nr:TadE/TadG family type IV pilus assembly protein [Oceanobacillus salinisoli]